VKTAIAWRRHLSALGAAALALSAALAAPPQTVYRCGADGRSYSQTPCADVRPVNADDSRSASQQEAAREGADRDSQQAQKLAEERRQREAVAKGQAAAGFKTGTAEAAADGPPAAMSPPMRVSAQTSVSK
jgi:hypothetical protein